MQTLILRNHCVFDLCRRMEEVLGDMVVDKNKNDVLRNRFGEKYSYVDLKKQYIATEAENNSSDIFVKTFKLEYSSMRDAIYCIRLTRDILVYSVYDLERQRTLYNLPWSYPNKITAFGTPGRYAPQEIMQDFLKLPYLKFYFKYVLHQSINSIYETPKHLANNTYALSDTLGVVLSWHMDFYPLEKGVLKNPAKPVYIADTWYYEDEEILHDLLNLPTVTFGERYHTTWV